MALPIIIAGGVALYGAVKGTKGFMDSKEAKERAAEAERLVEKEKHTIEKEQESLNKTLKRYGERKLGAFNGGALESFVRSFSRLKNVTNVHTPQLDRLELGGFSEVFLDDLRNSCSLLKSSGLGVGTGLGSGAALAFGAYNGTMLLATASTGTAISTLSGAAATNATLAWLGGGSIAAGGGGMALGTMVLGSLVAGPAIAIFGHIVGNKGAEALAIAQSNEEKAKTYQNECALVCGKLQAIHEVVKLANTTFLKVIVELRRSTEKLDGVIEVCGENYAEYAEESQSIVFRSVKIAQLTKAMIDTPILDVDGNLVLSSKKQIEDFGLQLRDNNVL